MLSYFLRDQKKKKKPSEKMHSVAATLNGGAIRHFRSEECKFDGDAVQKKKRSEKMHTVAADA